MSQNEILTKFSTDDHGNVEVIRFNPSRLQDTIAPKVYRVVETMFGFMLQYHSDRFVLPATMFGNTEERASKLFARYQETGNLSALLTGNKGAGKTVLSSTFANKAIDAGIPVILVNSYAEGLTTFLGRLGNVVCLFDEFAKKFGEHQDKMLDFFSGNDNAPRACFIIDNDETSITQYIRERPSRALYHYSYKKLSMDVVKQVCEHYHLSDLLSECVMSYAARTYNLTMDTLTRVVEECLFESGDINNQNDFTKLIDVLNVPKAVDTKLTLASLRLSGAEISFKGVRTSATRSTVYLYIDLDKPTDLLAAMKKSEWFNNEINDYDWEDGEKREVRVDLNRKFDMGDSYVYSNDASGLTAQALIDYSTMDTSYQYYV